MATVETLGELDHSEKMSIDKINPYGDLPSRPVSAENDSEFEDKLV